MKEPRKYGIAQKEHLRSHPLAIFKGAIGALPSRLRSTVPIGLTSLPLAISRLAARSTGAIGSRVLRSFGTWVFIFPPSMMVFRRYEISL